jgi:hypothetical protein
MRKNLLPLVICIFLLSACTLPTAPVPTSLPVIPSLVPTPVVLLPVPTNTLPPLPSVVPTIPPAPPPSPTATPVFVPVAVDVGAVKYIDDRSTPVSLIASLYNAINRKEYLRAYSYWEPGSSVSGVSLATYAAGYSTTVSVQITVGQTSGDAAAGNLYYSLPVILVSKTTDGKTTNYEACYQFHISNPGVQGTPPFKSLGIRLGGAKVVATGVDPLTKLPTACTDTNVPGSDRVISTPPVTSPADISAARYLDDRSDAVQVMRSLFNAINRSEYVRAYSYWEPSAALTQLPPFNNFAAGYADTASVQLTTGALREEGAAGSLYAQVPVTLVATTRSGVIQTFVGCYILHMTNPGLQETPPFHPWGVQSAHVTQVANNANTTTLMATACP